MAVSHLAKRFAGRPAADDVTFEVAPTETVAIIGPSGCGKTTLLRLVAGLERPDSGEIELAGRLVTRGPEILVPPHQRDIGFVFQDLALWPHLTIAQQLDFVLRSTGLDRSGRRARIRELLELVHLADLEARYPHEISGGEQQRVALARALAGRPRLLLLDEPFSSLDPELRAALRLEVGRVQRALTIAAIYVTHDREDAAVLADRVLEMRESRIVDTHSIAREEHPS